MGPEGFYLGSHNPIDCPSVFANINYPIICAYHHTAPVNSIFALTEALRLLKQEGLDRAWKRHQENSQRLVSGLRCLGLDMLVEDPAARLPQLNAVRLPVDIDEAAIRSRLLNEKNLEIGAGLGPLAGKVWRIGLMGYSSRLENVSFCLDALGSELGGAIQTAVGE